MIRFHLSTPYGRYVYFYPATFVTQTHYQVLGVPANAALAEIKRAYRRLVVQFHPDKHGGDSRFEDQFKAVSAAYRVLSDAGRRASYDFQLAQIRRRAEEERRRQSYRPAGQQVYGVPMPAPAPLRTRPPAGARERHYQPIPKQKVRFSRADYLLVATILGLMALFGTVLVLSLNHWAGRKSYEKAAQAFERNQWSSASSFADDALRFRPDFAPALRLRGELQQLVYHQANVALLSYQAALTSEEEPAIRARLYYRCGRCQMTLNSAAAADTSFERALRSDSTLARAYLARAENRLLDLRQTPQALNDLNHGLRLRAAMGRPPLWHYVQVRGLTFAHLGRLTEARRDYRAVLAAWPTSGRTHFLLGRLAEREGNRTAACEFFQRALTLGYAYAEGAYTNACRLVNGAAAKPAASNAGAPKSKAAGLSGGRGFGAALLH